MSQINEIEVGGKVYSIAGGGEGGSSTLAGLNDVELDAIPSANQVLTYDAESEKWINADATGGTQVIANPEEEPTDNLNKIQIKDKVYTISTEASLTKYDNEDSRLSATNVQEAIDELSTKINSLIKASESEDTF